MKLVMNALMMKKNVLHAKMDLYYIQRNVFLYVHRDFTMMTPIIPIKNAQYVNHTAKHVTLLHVKPVMIICILSKDNK